MDTLPEAIEWFREQLRDDPEAIIGIRVWVLGETVYVMTDPYPESFGEIHEGDGSAKKLKMYRKLIYVVPGEEPGTWSVLDGPYPPGPPLTLLAACEAALPYVQ